jgi:GNAT superfamily N-acetyltransferase
MQIRQMCDADLSIIGKLVSESNRDVAVQFGLNADNCPRHPSLCTESWVRAELERGETYFILEDAEGKPVGCVAFESPGPGRGYLNRLSVLPGHRGKGAGARLVRHVVEHARSRAVELWSTTIFFPFLARRILRGRMQNQDAPHGADIWPQ